MDQFRANKRSQFIIIIIIMSLIYYYVVSPGEPLHHFSPHHRQRPDNSQTRTLGVRVSFPSHSNNSFPLFQSTMAVFTFTDPDMRRSPMAIKQPISIFQLTPNFWYSQVIIKVCRFRSNNSYSMYIVDFSFGTWEPAPILPYAIV